MSWHGIMINLNHIIVDTGQSCKINMPHNGEYAGWSFWHPRKLIWDARGDMYEIRYSDKWIFHLKKYGAGHYNSYEVLDEQDISIETFIKEFDNDTGYIPPEEPLIHVPKKLKPEKRDVIEELKDE